jgi:hypothetical protein
MNEKPEKSVLVWCFFAVAGDGISLDASALLWN